MVKDSMLGAFQEHICSECNRCTGKDRLQNINIRYEKACHIMDCPTLNAVNRAAAEREARIEQGIAGTEVAVSN